MNHSLRYIDWPRGTSAERKVLYDAGKRARYVCSCGKLGDWKKNTSKAAFDFDEHVRWKTRALSA